MEIYYKEITEIQLHQGYNYHYKGTGYDAEGEFIFHGNGKLYNKENKLIYEGGFADGEYSGTGTLYNDKGFRIYEGHFADGKYNGKGNLYNYKGLRIYEGDFVDGKYNGKGTLYNYKGLLIYEGDFHQGTCHGNGKSYSPNGSLVHTGIFIHGDYYEGDFVNEKACGNGILYPITSSNPKYKGDMKDDKPNGSGVSYNIGGELKFEGEFANGLPHGRGRKYLLNGKIQEGIFVHDNYYIGDLSEGKANGKGRLYNDRGCLRYIGDFSNGLEDGKGRIYFSHGMYWELQYEGNFTKGYKNGIGKEYWKNVLIYEGSFKNGQRHGKGREYADGILLYIGDFVQGKHQGRGVILCLDGNLAYIGDFSEDQITGQGVLYDNGRIFYEGGFLAGKQHGFGREYNPDGSILRDGIFRTDEFIECAPFIRRTTETVSMTAPGRYKLLYKAVMQAPAAPPLPAEELLILTEECQAPSRKEETLNARQVPSREEETLNACMRELNNLIGLTEVKQEINQLINKRKVQNERIRRGMKKDTASHHLVFTGNPGTGKTTVARLLSKIFKELGIVSKESVIEIDRAGLVGGYIGHTALKTEKVIEKALGGILFIDEAYALAPEDSPRDFGPEAIDTLLKRMEDYRNDLVVIVAGYDAPMERFLNSNPGLKSRFPTVIHFSNYTEQELMEIFLSFCREEEYQIDKSGQCLFLSQITGKRNSKNFSNGRYIRNLFEKLIKAQANRLSTLDLSEVSDNDLKTFTVQDVQYLIDQNEFEKTN